MAYKPLSDRVILQQEDAEEKTKSGIVIPSSAQEKPQRGTVVAVGPGKRSTEGKHIPLSVKEGDTVVYAKYGGTELPSEENDKTYLIVKEDDILAVIGK